MFFFKVNIEDCSTGNFYSNLPPASQVTVNVILFSVWPGERRFSVLSLPAVFSCRPTVKTSIILQLALHLVTSDQPASIRMFLFLSLTLAVPVNCLNISVSTTTSSPSSAFHSHPSGRLTVEEGNHRPW